MPLPFAFAAGRYSRAHPPRNLGPPIQISYAGALEVGTKQITIKTRNIPRVGIAVFANTPPGYPWYDAETRDNLAVNAQGELQATVTLRAVGDRIKVFASTGPDARDFSQQAESAFAVAAPGGPAPTVPGTGNAAAVFAKMGAGINQERYTAVDHADARTAAYYQRYRDLGLKQVRFFIPVRWDQYFIYPGSADNATIDRYLDAVDACVDSGMPVSWVDACDVIGDWHLTGQARIDELDAYIQRFAARVAARNWPVDRVIVGAINEYGGGTNTFWEPHRLRWNNYLRAALPNHTIVEGPAYWKDPRALFSDRIDDARIMGGYVPWSDTNTIQDCHHYLGWPADGMDWVGGEIRKWSAANGRAVVMGEHGFDSHLYANMDNLARWIERIDAETQYENVCLLRPTWWATTNGSDWPMTEPDGNTMRPGMADGVKRWSSRVDARIAAATPATPAQPSAPGSGATLNILVRGQSNAQLFCDRGGAARLRDRLQAATGRTVNVIYRYGAAGDNTIYSATAFLDWDTDGQQAALLRIYSGQPASRKTAPFVEIWMHNEYDQNNQSAVGSDWTTATWVGECRADATKVRQALGLTAAQHLRYFVPIRYAYGDIKRIRDGMDQLAADASFNARVSMAAWSARMDGGPEPGNNGSHIGDQDALDIGEALATEIAALYPAGSTAPPPPPPGGTEPPPADEWSISLSPQDPGTRAAGVWNTTATLTGITNYLHVVQNGPDENWTWEPGTQVTGTVPGNGQVPIAAEFTRTGQFVSVVDADDYSRQGMSGQVTIG